MIHFRTLKNIRKAVFLFCLAPCSLGATVMSCHPLLWPDESPVVNESLTTDATMVDELKTYADTLLNKQSHPLPLLSSSGKKSIDNLDLIMTREAFLDADHAAVLAMAYRLTHRIDYLNKSKEILIDWSMINHPTGHPINETRLDSMIWAYDLIACDLSQNEKDQILNWFSQMRLKKIAWKFGNVTTSNNHRIHQLKMLLLLDKILEFNQAWKQDVETAKRYSTINLNPQQGVSIDYLQRNALYYHNYVVQPWLEISLITNQFWPSPQKAFSFLKEKIISHDLSNEFSNSQAKLDRERAKGGFKYATKGGTFDVQHATPTIITYYTIIRSTPNQALWRIVVNTKSSAKIIFLNARRMLWHIDHPAEASFTHRSYA
jgi:hypothetical protein